MSPCGTTGAFSLEANLPAEQTHFRILYMAHVHGHGVSSTWRLQTEEEDKSLIKAVELNKDGLHLRAASVGLESVRVGFGSACLYTNWGDIVIIPERPRETLAALLYCAKPSEQRRNSRSITSDSL